MSLHKHEEYQIPELIAALKAHHLATDTPSQLADAFRTGWMHGRAQTPPPAVLPVVAWQSIWTAPKDKSEFLAWWPHLNGWRVTYWIARKGENRGWRCYALKSTAPLPMLGEPTHWMRLPATPPAASAPSPKEIAEWRG